MLLPSTAYTWSAKVEGGAKGIKDKRQFTLTPAINAAGQLVAMQLISKGKTTACEPSSEFKQRFYSKRDREFPKLLFDFNHTPNHWCPEETMQQLISMLEQYRQRVCEEKGLAAEQKMVLRLYVYCRHRDKGFCAYIRAHCPNTTTTFVPVNLTSLCQPLDMGFNFVFKRNIAHSLGLA
jgi:hypothetical protein